MFLESPPFSPYFPVTQYLIVFHNGGYLTLDGWGITMLEPTGERAQRVCAREFGVWTKTLLVPFIGVYGPVVVGT